MPHEPLTAKAETKPFGRKPLPCQPHSLGNAALQRCSERGHLIQPVGMHQENHPPCLKKGSQVSFHEKGVCLCRQCHLPARLQFSVLIAAPDHNVGRKFFRFSKTTPSWATTWRAHTHKTYTQRSYVMFRRVATWSHIAFSKVAQKDMPWQKIVPVLQKLHVPCDELVHVREN